MKKDTSPTTEQITADATKPMSAWSPPTSPFWLTEPIHQLFVWVRSEEEVAHHNWRAKRRRHRQARKTTGAICKQGCIDRFLAMTDGVEVVGWRALRLLVLVNLCAIAMSAVVLVALLFVATPELGTKQLGVIAGSALSAITTGGAISWRIVRRQSRFAQKPTA